MASDLICSMFRITFSGVILIDRIHMMERMPSFPDRRRTQDVTSIRGANAKFLDRGGFSNEIVFSRVEHHDTYAAAAHSVMTNKSAWQSLGEGTCLIQFGEANLYEHEIYNAVLVSTAARLDNKISFFNIHIKGGDIQVAS